MYIERVAVENRIFEFSSSNKINYTYDYTNIYTNRHLYNKKVNYVIGYPPMGTHHPDPPTHGYPSP